MLVWGYVPAMPTRAVDMHIDQRRRLGPYADQYIETVVGIGVGDSFRGKVQRSSETLDPPATQGKVHFDINQANAPTSATSA